jgi:transposase
VCHAALSVIAILLRVAWRSVSDIVARVVAERAGQTDRLAGLRSTRFPTARASGIYLLVVTCHDTGRLVWAGKNRTKETLGRFFDDLGVDRARQLWSGHLAARAAIMKMGS